MNVMINCNMWWPNRQIYRLRAQTSTVLRGITAQCKYEQYSQEEFWARLFMGVYHSLASVGRRCLNLFLFCFLFSRGVSGTIFHKEQPDVRSIPSGCPVKFLLWVTGALTDITGPLRNNQAHTLGSKNSGLNPVYMSPYMRPNGWKKQHICVAMQIFGVVNWSSHQ